MKLPVNLQEISVSQYLVMEEIGEINGVGEKENDVETATHNNCTLLSKQVMLSQ